jgi:hypothetical protein
MPARQANVKNKKQYEALKQKRGCRRSETDRMNVRHRSVDERAAPPVVANCSGVSSLNDVRNSSSSS